MVARVWLAADPGIDAGRLQALGGRPVEQQVVDAEAGVSLPMLAEVIPEGEHLLFGVLCADRVDPALAKQAFPARAAFWL